jgi:DNA-binding beta-propeller fold protein YncE
MILPAVGLLALCTLAQAQPNLYVASFGSNQVLKYSGTDGAPLGAFVTAGSGGLIQPLGLVFSPWTGELLVGSSATGQVLKYDGNTGASRGLFGAATTPRGLSYGPGLNLLVAQDGSNKIQKFETYVGTDLGTLVTGAFAESAVVSPFSGNLLVSDFNASQILQFNANTGAPLGVFASGGGLISPFSIVFSPWTKNLLVASRETNQVLQYDGRTGAFLGIFASANLSLPFGLTFGPDSNLYVSNFGNNTVTKYNGLTGDFLGTFVTAGSGGLSFPGFLTFGSR